MLKNKIHKKKQIYIFLTLSDVVSSGLSSKRHNNNNVSRVSTVRTLGTSLVSINSPTNTRALSCPRLVVPDSFSVNAQI